MDDEIQKSCWGAATWTVLMLGSGLAVAFLFGAF